MTYIVQAFGYHDCKEFNTIKEARAHLRQLLKESTKSCKARCGNAYVHRFGDSAQVTLGQDKRSNLWAAFSINKY